MPVVVVSPFNVASFPEGGGHFWVYLHTFSACARPVARFTGLKTFSGRIVRTTNLRHWPRFLARMEKHGLRENVILYSTRAGEPSVEYSTCRATRPK